VGGSALAARLFQATFCEVADPTAGLDEGDLGWQWSITLFGRGRLAGWVLLIDGMPPLRLWRDPPTDDLFGSQPIVRLVMASARCWKNLPAQNWTRSASD
jgi:hypothetical protein